MDKTDVYLEMRFKVEAVFKHYTKQSAYYQQANVIQRLVMQDRFYHLSMELLSRIIGPFDVTQ